MHHDWLIFCVAMRENDSMCGPTFEEQPDENFLHSLTQKVRHDWPISHVAMRESDTFHLTGTLAQKSHGNPDRIKFVSTS